MGNFSDLDRRPLTADEKVLISAAERMAENTVLLAALRVACRNRGMTPDGHDTAAQMVGALEAVAQKDEGEGPGAL